MTYRCNRCPIYKTHGKINRDPVSKEWLCDEHFEEVIKKEKK